MEPRETRKEELQKRKKTLALFSRSAAVDKVQQRAAAREQKAKGAA